MHAVNEMHVDDERTVLGIEFREFLRYANRAAHGLEISFCNQRVKIGYVEVLLKMNGIKDSGLLGNGAETLRILKAVNPVFREIHIQFHERKAEALTKLNVLFEGFVFNQCRHSEQHGTVLLLLIQPL